MRAFSFILCASMVGPSIIASQEPSARPVLVDDVPQGTNWVANARTRIYYRVGCPITVTIAAVDKLYYKSEASLRSSGFTKSEECHIGGPATPISDSSPLAAGTPGPAQGTEEAQEKHRRTGFWFNGGLGYGSLGCQDCVGRTEELTGNLALGGTVSRKVYLGAGTTGWSHSQFGSEFTVGTLLAVIRFYPSAAAGGFFLMGGLGLGSVRTEFEGVGSDTETGFGALVGLGYDFRVARNVSLTPFGNGFTANTSDIDVHVWQIGLGVTVH